MLNNLKNRLSTRLGILSSVALIGALAVVMFAIPQITNVHTSAENCVNPPVTPTFNYWPTTYDDQNTPLCHDFPAIDAAKFVQGQESVFSQNEADWQNGLQLNDGETGVALMYIHNGAANNLPAADTTAKNVKITTQTDTSVGGQHTLRVTYSADNAASYTKSYTVHTPSNAKLEVIANSGQMYDYEGRVITSQGNLNMGNSTFTLGDLDACFEYSLFFTFKFKVVTPNTQPDNTTLSIDKTVRNITKNTNFSDSVNADRNDKVEYKIKVKNTGTAIARTVTMTDQSVAGISVDNGSTKVDNLFQGVIPGTINLGDLNPGQEKTISYTGTVTASSGTLVNTATAVASNASQVSDTARVVITVVNDNTTLSIDKSVRNVTKNTSYSTSVNADRNDSVQYRVIVTNTGSTTARTVTMSDNGTSGVSINSSTTTVGIADDALLSNNLWQGTIPGTLNLGDLRPGEKRYITYSGTVTASSGSLTNTAYAQASNASRVSDTATVVVMTTPSGTRNLRIEKSVNKSEVRTGDTVQFTVTVTNNGNRTVDNVVMKDNLPSDFRLGSIINSTSNRYSSTGSNIDVEMGSLSPNQSSTIRFEAQVVATGERTICNVAYATGDGVSRVSDDACVRIIRTDKPGTPNIVISKKAYNDTKKIDAVSANADRGNYITFTLVTTNTGSETARNYVITDDLSGVLPLADLITAPNAKLSGNTLSYEAMDIKPGETVTKTFQVRVKESLATTISYRITNTYGNTVVINIPGKVVFEAPKTGAAGTSAGVFAGLVTAGFVLFRKRENLLKFILN